MNIFLPYENDISKSVQSLDDKRLKNPPAYVAEENLIPLEVFVSCCANEKEFTRAYMQVLEIVTNKALKKLDS